MQTFVLIASLLVQTSAAQSPRDAPDAPAIAKQAIAEGEFEKALKQLDRAVTRTRDPKELAELHLLRAQSFHALGQTDPAQAAMTRALEADPEAALDPERSNPQLIALLDRVRTKVIGILEVAVTPSQGEVLVDEVPYGAPPVRLELPVGRHRVTARDEATGQVVDQEVVVSARQTVKLSLVLPAPPPPTEVSRQTMDPAPGDERAEVGFGATQVSDTVPPRLSGARVLVPAGLGVVLGVGGGVFYWMARQTEGRIRGGHPSIGSREDLDEALRRGRLQQTTAFVLWGAGAAALTAAGILWATTPSGPEVAAVPAPGGGGLLVVSARFD